jgi:hypothetical protein
MLFMVTPGWENSQAAQGAAGVDGVRESQHLQAIDVLRHVGASVDSGPDSPSAVPRTSRSRASTRTLRGENSGVDDALL